MVSGCNFDYAFVFVYVFVFHDDVGIVFCSKRKLNKNKQTKIPVDMHFLVFNNFSSLDPQNICVAAFQFHVKRKSISNLKSGLILLKTKRPAAETKVTPNMKK